MFTNFYRSIKLKLAVLALLFFGFGLETMATHLAGGDLFYVHLGGLRYRVTLRLYRDCSGINLTNETLNVSIGRCGPTAGGVSGAGNAAPTRRDTQKIFCDRYSRNFICSAANDPANPGRPSNFEAVDYVFTVTLPSRQRNWVFWWSSGARPDINNLNSGSSGNAYIDAFLNNQDFDGNNSASFNPIDVPLPYVCWNEPYTYSFNAIEADGDSLSYSLEAPMLNCSTFSTYSTHATTLIFDTTIVPPTFAVVPGGAFSKDFPIGSYVVRRNPTTGRDQAVRSFLFDPTTGAITFIPRFYTAPANTADGINKHGLVVRIREWRRDGTGRMRIIGETQRDILITVVDCGGNRPPSLPTGTVPPITQGGITTRRDSALVELTAQTCTYTAARLAFNDSNGTNNITVVYPGFGAPGRLPFPSSLATFTVTGNKTKTPRGILAVNASAADIGKEYEFPVRLEDDACPVKGIRTLRVKVKIVQGNFANAFKPGGILTTKDTICFGDSTQIEGRVLRPDTTLGGAPVTYSYAWPAAPGLDSTVRKIVTVKPPYTNRYRFIAYNDQYPGCFDTASVLVVVRNPVVPSIRAFYAATDEGTSGIAPVKVRLFNGSTPLIDADKCTWYLQRYIRQADTLALDLDSGIISRQTHPDTLVELKKPGIYVFRLDVDTRTKSSLRCFATAYDTLVVPEITAFAPNVLTANNDGQNDELKIVTPSGDVALTIYNRYGVPIKTWSKYDNSFKAEDLPSGTYYYFMKDNVSNEVKRSWLQILK